MARLRIIPLGGSGDVGRNLTVLEYDGHIVCVDCGLMFPESDMLGVDLVLPNFGYLVDHVEAVDGYLITHGHEDHIGALPYILPHVPAPIYATRLTRGLIEVKLKEHRLLDSAELVTIAPGDEVPIGPFTALPFRASHSIPDAVGYGIDTPLGLVVHTGEFKFDLTPVDARPTDLHRLAEFGSRGVLVLLSDSTNAERAGHTPSEATVRRALERVFAAAPGRIIIATFASNISRVQEILNVAANHDRRVAVVGRSMEKNVAMALKLGYLRAPDGLMVSIGALDALPHPGSVVVCTGTQG
ncbi:MAG: ribonuclease J, partial [Anaerolineae bacterium]